MAAWGRRGLGAVTVGVLEGWTVVVPTGPARARHPYDDAVRSLAGRPVGWRMRPALGVFHVGRQAVLVVHPDRSRTGWRAVQRWAVWTPRRGRVATPGLAAARAEDIVEAAGTRTPEAATEAAVQLRDLLADGRSDALCVLAGVLGRLDLPGLELLTGELAPVELPAAREVAAAPRHARAFDRLVADEFRSRTEVES